MSSARNLDTSVIKRKMHRNNSVVIKLGTFIEESKSKELKGGLEAIKDEGSVKSDFDSLTDLPSEFVIQKPHKYRKNSLDLESPEKPAVEVVRFDFMKEWNLASFHKEQEQNEQALQKHVAHNSQ